MEKPKTRKEALKNFNHLEKLLEKEKDPREKNILLKKIIQANEEYKRVKKIEVAQKRPKGFLAKIKRILFG